MSLELLKNNIKIGVKSFSGTELGRFQHYNATLNKILKNQIIDPENIQLAFGDDLENTIKRYKTYLESQGKDDNSIRSFLTRLRGLSNYYSKVFEIDVEKVTFTELLQLAVARKYGSKLYTKRIALEERHLHQKYTTYLNVAKDIVISSCEDPTKPWGDIDLKKNDVVRGLAKGVLPYLFGDIVPGPTVSDERIHFMERFLLLPKNSLLIKLSNRLDVSNRKKRNSEKSVSHKNAISNKYKTLNPKLQLLFDEYCDFKIHSKQPEIRNISNTSKDSDYFELVNKVTETGYSVGWSFNSLMICNSQQAFFKDLIGFLNFCTRELNINYDDIGSEHLTNPKIIYELSNYGKSLKSGGSWIVNLLRFIKRTIAPKGYLRLCGHLGDRTFDKFNADLDFLNEAYEQLLKDAKKGVFKSKKMSDQGKKSINFLLNMDVNERIAVMKKANDFIYKVATSHHLEYKRCLKLANKKVSESASKKSLSKARTAIHYAYNHMFALLMKETASVNCPRLSNWIMMKYYPSTKEQDKSTASFTYLRQRNQFNLHVPLTGTSVLPEFDDHAYRYLKNAEAPLTVPIDIDLPKSLTPLIKKFIAIREDYIYLDICKDTDIDPKSIALLFPWKRVQDRGTNGGFNEGKEIKKLHKKNYIAQPDKLNKTFEGVMRSAYSHVLPYVKQHGFNPHALRHLAVETHLDLYPDDIAGAATILNDDPKQVWKTYGNKDRSKVMQRVSKLERYGNSYE